MYIIDRDGVLFDTCELNIKSYSEAADLLKLETNIVNLTNSIHAGDSYSRFCRNVWQDIDQNDVIKLSKSLFNDWNGKAFSIETNLFPILVEEKKLNCVISESDFIDIGIPEDYHKFCNGFKVY